MAQNKVNFGLRKVYFAPFTLDAQGKEVYEKPIAIPGAVSLELSPNDDSSTFYADNSAYYTTFSGGGQYEGTLEIANVPEEFSVKCLGEKRITGHNLISESSNPIKQEFALLFQVEGDKYENMYCFFRCTCSRPTVSSETTTETTEPHTVELSFTAIPRESDELVKLKTSETTSLGVKDSWYERVYDGILNSVAQPNITFDRKVGEANNGDKTFAIVTTGGAKMTGLKVNGVSVATGNANANWQYTDTNNTLVIKKAYLDTLGIAFHDIIVQMDKGNNVSLKLTVQQTA